MKKARMVLVKWLDSATTTEPWHKDDRSLKVATCRSVGFLHEKRRNRVVLAQSVGSDREVGQLIAIPRVAILRMRKVKRS